MPQFDLRGIKIAKYVNTAGVITYTDAQKNEARAEAKKAAKAEEKAAE